MSVPSPAAYLREAAVTAYIGTNPVRAQEGRALQGWSYPYITWTVIGMTPEVALDEVPRIDACRVQIDVWSDTASECKELALVVRDLIEPDHVMTAMSFPGRDPDTNAWRGVLEFSFWNFRELEVSSN